MRSKLIIALVFLTILLSGCGQKAQNLNKEVSDESKASNETVKTTKKTVANDENTTEAKEIGVIENKASAIEHYVRFDDAEMKEFKKAFNDNDFRFNPFMSETDNEPIVYIFDTRYKDYDLTVNNTLSFLEMDYSLMVNNYKTDYMFSRDLKGILISEEEKDFLDDLLSVHTGNCLVGDRGYSSEERNQPTEENFKGTQELIEEFYGSSEAYIQQTTEAINHCYRDVMGYTYDDSNYQFHKLSSDQIEEGISSVNKLIEAKEDYIYDIESFNDDSPYLFSEFEAILRTNDDIKRNKKKQAYIEDIQVHFDTIIPYVTEYIEWSGEMVDEYHSTKNNPFTSYNETITLSLEQLKAEEEYLLDITEKMKEGGLGGLLQF